MAQDTLTFVSHEHRDVQTTDGTKRVHKFKTPDGTTYQTWNANLASQLKQRLTQPVPIIFDTTEKNGYRNHTLREIAASDSSGAAQGAVSGVAPGEGTAAPAPGPKQDWDAKEQRITRSFGVNAALKALEIAGGDKEAASQILLAAVELAPIPAVYAWSGRER